MEYSPILVPVVALVAWTLVVMLWMMVARRRAFAQLGINWANIPRGSRGANLDGRAPGRGAVAVAQLQSPDGTADASSTRLR